MKLVRIHPYDPHRGFKCRTYILSGSGYPKFDVTRGWYEVDDATAARLKKILNNPNDPRSQRVFQVVTKAQAEALDEAEADEVAEASAPIALPEEIARKLGKKPRKRKNRKPIVPEPAEFDEDDDEDETDAFDEDNEDFDEDAADWPEDMADESDEDEGDEEEEESADLTSEEVRSKPKPPARRKKTTSKAKPKKATSKTKTKKKRASSRA